MRIRHYLQYLRVFRNAQKLTTVGANGALKRRLAPHLRSNERRSDKRPTGRGINTRLRSYLGGGLPDVDDARLLIEGRFSHLC